MKILGDLLMNLLAVSYRQGSYQWGCINHKDLPKWCFYGNTNNPHAFFVDWKEPVHSYLLPWLELYWNNAKDRLTNWMEKLHYPSKRQIVGLKKVLRLSIYLSNFLSIYLSILGGIRSNFSKKYLSTIDLSTIDISTIDMSTYRYI